MVKPWYKSLSIGGALLSALGYLSRPDVFDVLPKTLAAVVTVAGMVVSVFGVRRAIPDAALVATDAGTVAVVDPSGILAAHLEAPRNAAGETAGEEAARRAVMDSKGAELQRTLDARAKSRGGE